MRDPADDPIAFPAAPASIGYSDDVIGHGPLENRIARLVGRALQDARGDGTYRGEVAGRMATYLGRPISQGTLDKWSSEAADNHRIPLDAFVALVDATRQHALLGFIPGLFGYAVVSAAATEVIRLHALLQHRERVARHQAETDAQIHALEARLRGRS